LAEAPVGGIKRCLMAPASASQLWGACWTKPGTLQSGTDGDTVHRAPKSPPTGVFLPVPKLCSAIPSQCWLQHPSIPTAGVNTSSSSKLFGGSPPASQCSQRLKSLLTRQIISSGPPGAGTHADIRHKSSRCLGTACCKSRVAGAHRRLSLTAYLLLLIPLPHRWQHRLQSQVCFVNGQKKKKNQISLFSGKLLKVHPRPLYFHRPYKNSAGTQVGTHRLPLSSSEDGQAGAPRQRGHRGATASLRPGTLGAWMGLNPRP